MLWPLVTNSYIRLKCFPNIKIAKQWHISLNFNNIISLLFVLGSVRIVLSGIELVDYKILCCHCFNAIARYTLIVLQLTESICLGLDIF